MNWDVVHKSREGAKYPDTELVRFMAKNYYVAEDRSRIKVLEIGCGTGANLWYILREGFSPTGVDGSEFALKQAMKRFEPTYAPLFHLGDILETLRSIPDESRDVIVDVEAVYANTFSDAKFIYNECHRVLKPGGKMFIKTFADGTEIDALDETYVRLTKFGEIKPLLSKFSGLSIFKHQRETTKGLIVEWVIEATK